MRGTADTADGPTPYAFFVKLVQTWSRSPLFAEVPEEFREVAAASFPWRTEAAVYRSDLANRLPDGLRLPRVYRVHEVDHESYAVWLEAVPAVDTTWDEPRFERAARLLGRLAASRTVAELARVGDFPFVVAHYASSGQRSGHDQSDDDFHNLLGPRAEDESVVVLRPRRRMARSVRERLAHRVRDRRRTSSLGRGLRRRTTRPSPATRPAAVAAERATVTRFSLDLLAPVQPSDQERFRPG